MKLRFIWQMNFTEMSIDLYSQVNFLIFINVIRILVQKLRSPSVGGNDTSHFK